MDMSLVERGIGRETIQIPLAIHIVDPDALAARDDHIQRMVIVRAVLLPRAGCIPGCSFMLLNPCSIWPEPI